MTAKLRYALELPPLPYYLGSGKAVYTPGDQHPNRSHLGMFDLLLLVKGSLHIGENDRTWTLREGQLLLLSPDGYHYATKPCEEETIFYWLHFECRGGWSLEELEAAAAFPSSGQPFTNTYKLCVPQFALIGQSAAAYRIFDQLLEHSLGHRSSSFWQEQTLFTELLRMLEQEDNAQHSPTVRHLAETTEAYLKQHFQEHITNEALADSLHFHVNYIVRCMKEVYGCTPLEYLLGYRIEQAKLLLINTSWPISQISEHIGFSYAPYFTSCFQKKVGVSPLRFRKQFWH
ncbi:helix-turn-helix transcriptional regulator [Paenibacillus hexagrammi]|uniref:AraC family transcriptional regulator n=1 Tax=Paenibacillus hexagrammi TaxID=2908839 RepID=A0ABY3SLU9_9BACL|nr:AraC family transcriptional regulator [Paenibacillus sp. YPD9-1]UJF34520.1 AraC family transcriptional regulator [Paenibacillus sp. YPD9-1]